MAGINFEVGPIASSEWKDGALTIGADQQGAAGTGRQMESLQPLGLISRPNDPTTNELAEVQTAAGALYGTRGDDQYVIPLGDPALIGKIPQVSKGGTCLYNGTGAFIVQNGQVEKGSTMIYVPYKDGSTDKAMVVSIDVGTDGSQNIQIVHGDGHGVKMLGGGKHEVILSNKAGNGFVIVDDDGVKIAGNTTLVGGTVVGNSPTAQPVMLAPDLMTWITQANVAFAAIAAAGGNPTNPTVTAPVAVPALTTLLSASPTP